MKRRALKSKEDCPFWSSAKSCKIFSKINYSVESSLQKWIISHPYIIKYPIANDYIKVNFYDGIRRVTNEPRHKVLLRVSFH